MEMILPVFKHPGTRQGNTLKALIYASEKPKSGRRA
jgi:hypothetical protein